MSAMIAKTETILGRLQTHAEEKLFGDN